MNIPKLGTPQSYAAFYQTLDKQADLMDNSLLDALPEKGDVYIASSYASATGGLETLQTETRTIARGESTLSFTNRVESGPGYELSKRHISYSKGEDGSLHVSDFNGKDFVEMSLPQA